MRLTLAALTAVVLALPLRAEPARVAVVTKEARLTGTLSVGQLEVEVNARVVKVPIADVTSVAFGDSDVVVTRQGKRIKGVVRVDGWTLREAAAGRPAREKPGDEKPAPERPLARADLKWLVPRIPLGPPKKGRIVDAAAATGMTYHVRVPEKYDAAAGGPAIILLHGSNANSADYVKGVAQRWPKVAADYVLIGIDGEWPAQKNPDGPPAFNYTYVNFVGKSKYKGFPGTDRESPALVAEAVGEIRQQLKLTRVFVAGHSQGGFLVYSCLMNYPELFAGGMPISAGLIVQCEPTAFEDAALRKAQRRRPLAIVHGDKDPLVSVTLAKSAYDSFLADGFPMLRLLLAKGAGHAFISLPFEEALRWLESMASDDPRALQASADRAFAKKDYRDALAFLDRQKEIDSTGTPAASARAMRQKIEALAAAPAKALEAAIRKNDGGGWVADFETFRRQFEFTAAAAPVMAEYAKVHKAHEGPAEKLWSDARKAFQAGDKAKGRRLCQEIVARYYASSYARFAKQSLEEQR